MRLPVPMWVMGESGREQILWSWRETVEVEAWMRLAKSASVRMVRRRFGSGLKLRRLMVT